MVCGYRRAAEVEQRAQALEGLEHLGDARLGAGVAVPGLPMPLTAGAGLHATAPPCGIPARRPAGPVPG